MYISDLRIQLTLAVFMVKSQGLCYKTSNIASLGYVSSVLRIKPEIQH